MLFRSYLFLFRAQGINFSQMQGVSEMLESIIVVLVLLTGAILIMWMGEVLTQRGIGNGMSLIIFVNIMAGLGPTLVREWTTQDTGSIITVITLLVIMAIIPVIVFIERGQRRIPVQYAKRVVGRRIMGANATYLPIKVNTAGVVPIIFASAVLYLPAQLAVGLISSNMAELLVKCDLKHDRDGEVGLTRPAIPRQDKPVPLRGSQQGASLRLDDLPAQTTDRKSVV